MLYNLRSVQDAHHHWWMPDHPNGPLDYLSPDKWRRSEFLAERVSEWVIPEAAILEIGCNAGRNLAVLQRAGFTNLAGVEISERAIGVLRTMFPGLAATRIYHGAIENVVSVLGAYNLIFTMAVFQHIHPASESVFAQIADLVAGYLITIEDERSRAEYHYPRNYRDVFEAFGLEQVDEQVGLSGIGLDDNFVYRCFRAG